MNMRSYLFTLLCVVFIVIVYLFFTDINVQTNMLNFIQNHKVYRYDMFDIKRDNKYKKIYIFYHIGTQNDIWENIVNEQLNLIVKSGLYDRIDKIYYGCNNDFCDRKLKTMFKNWVKIEPIPMALCPNIKSYENMTINALIEFSHHNPDCYILYLHNKGSFNISKTSDVWRNYMMKVLVENHQLCLDLLECNYNTIGTLYKPLILPSYYSGNFWWANTNYIKKIPYIQDLSYRYTAEFSLLKCKEKNKHINLGLRYLKYDLYRYQIPEYYFQQLDNINNIPIYVF